VSVRLSDPTRALLRHIERAPCRRLTFGPLLAEFLTRRHYEPRVFVGALIEALHSGELAWDEDGTGLERPL
jgi:hypothetical protein